MGNLARHRELAPRSDPLSGALLALTADQLLRWVTWPARFAPNCHRGPFPGGPRMRAIPTA